MMNTSNIECVQENGIIRAFHSFMFPVARNVDQDVIQLLETRMIDDRIYCKVRRIPYSVVNGHVMDLVNERHHLLIAGGDALTQNGVAPHGPGNRLSTTERLWLSKSIYDGCGSSKVCFGIPNGCVNERSCGLFGAVIYENGNFDFELLSMRKMKLFYFCKIFNFKF
jgi:hypothetical protein